MSSPTLLLASTSPYRAALLGRLGLPFRTAAPLVDETPFQESIADPIQLAAALAVAKAESLADVAPDALIIGGDQTLALDGRILGKPGSIEAAEQQLRELSGRTHQLITAVSVVEAGRTRLHVDVAELQMRVLDDDACRRYVQQDQPLDCAGSYRIESLGIALFESIRSGDQTAIVGLPLLAVVRMLRRCGVRLP